VNPIAPIDLLPLPTESRVHHNLELRAKEMKKVACTDQKSHRKD